MASSSKAPVRSGLSSGSKIRPPTTNRPHANPNPRSHSDTITNPSSASSHHLPHQKQKTHSHAGGESGHTGVTTVNDGHPEDANVKRVYERFRALGMPEGVSFEAFGRIMGASAGSAAEAGKAKDERTRISSKSESRGREQQQQLKEKEGEGDWNTALTFLSTHLVGRQEARKARGVISRCVALFPYHPSPYSLFILSLSPHTNRARAELANPSTQHPGASRIKVPSKSVSAVPGSGVHAPDKLSDLLVDPMALAARKREMAYRALEVARREWEGVSRGVRVLGEYGVLLSTFFILRSPSRGADADFFGFFSIPDAQRQALTNRVAERRRVLLLLEVLERREAVRMQRFGVYEGGMGTLLAELGWVFGA